MKKYFPKLTQNEVWIETDESGGGFNCPMLPVSKLGEINEIGNALGACKTLDEFEELRKRTIRLVRSVMPEKYTENLGRFTIEALTRLVAYLAYGDSGDDDQPKPEKKRIRDE